MCELRHTSLVVQKVHVVEQPVSITVPRYHESQPSPGSLPRGFFPCWPLLAALKLQAIFYAVATSREGHRSRRSGRALYQLEDHLVVAGNGRHRELRLHEDNLVATGLEISEQVHCGLGGGVLEVVHQHDAFAVLL